MADQASPMLESSSYAPGLEDGFPMPEQHLTVLLVGESGLGKTRWVYNVAAAHGIDVGGSDSQGCSQGLPRLPSTSLSRTASFASCPARWAIDLPPLQLPGGRGMLRLRLQDSPGHSDESNQARHLAALLEHVLLLREKDYRAAAAEAAEGPPPPPPLHSAALCLYFVHPSGPTPLDLAYMAALSRELPLLPLVARVDSLRPEELAAAAGELAAQMEAYTRGGYAPPIRTMQLQDGALAVGAEHPQHTDMALLDHLVGGGAAAAALQQAPARLQDFASDYEAMGCDLMGLLAWRMEAVEAELASAAATVTPRPLPEPLPCAAPASTLAVPASPVKPSEPTKTASPLRVVAAIEHIVRQLSRSIMGLARAEGAAGAPTTTHADAELAAEGVDVHISLPEDGRSANAAVENEKRTSAVTAVCVASEDKFTAAATGALHDGTPAQDLLTLTLAEGVATSLLPPSPPSPQPARDVSLLTSGFAAAAATAVASPTPSAGLRGARQDRSPSAVSATLQAARSDATVTAASQAFFPSPASSTFGSASDGWIDLEDLAEQQQQQQQQRGRDEAAVGKAAAVALFAEDRLSPTCGSAAKVYRNALYGEEVQEQEGGVAGAGVGHGLAEGEEEDEDVAAVRAVVRRALARAVAAEEDRTCVPALVQRVFARVRAAGECVAGSSSGSKGWFLSSLRASLPRMANLSTVWVTASTAPAKSAPAAPAFTRAYSLSSGSLTHMASYRYGAMAAASAACAATAAVLLARRRV